MAKCALDGGLYEESKIKRVRGLEGISGAVLDMNGWDAADGFTIRISSNLEFDEMKLFNLASRAGSKPLTRDTRVAMLSSAMINGQFQMLITQRDVAKVRDSSVSGDDSGVNLSPNANLLPCHHQRTTPQPPEARILSSTFS
jgi:hypothetical protein